MYKTTNVCIYVQIFYVQAPNEMCQIFLKHGTHMRTNVVVMTHVCKTLIYYERNNIPNRNESIKKILFHYKYLPTNL